MDVEAAVDGAAALLRDGAHVIDVGGESTRPGARGVPAELEIERTAPLIEVLRKRFDAPLSIDTRKAPVAQAALEAGAEVVNDVSGGGHDPGLAAVAARGGATLVLGHLRGDPETMQRDPHFDDPVAEVTAELADSARRAREAGVPDERLVVDPGLGFGKRLEDNLALLTAGAQIEAALGLPVLMGPSRKSFLGALTGDPAPARDRASLAACAVAVYTGARALRVHDPAGAVRAAAVGLALRRGRAEDSA